jgi:hypothetical protein
MSAVILPPFPGESIYSLKEGDRTLHIYGLILDPGHPARTTEDIARNLLFCEHLQALLRATFSLGGTYLLIWESPEGNYVVPDSGALRPCFYCHCNNQTHLGSSAKGLFKSLPQKEKPPLEDTDFFTSAFAKKGLFVMGRTPWQGLRQLLPNHYLDLKTGSIHRYFPMETHQSRSPKSVLPEVTKVLRGQIVAAANRYSLALPLTAGWDSRVLLAVSRSVLDHYSGTYTMRHPYMSDRHEDVRIPPDLARTAGISHQFFENTGEANPADEQLLAAEVDAPNPRNPAMHTNVYNTHLADQLIISGIASETAKRYYGEEKNLHPERLAILTGYGDHPFVVEALTEWLENAQPVSDLGYDILDFFHWEFNVGSSVAREVSQINLSRARVFPPFNQKQLINTLLQVPPQYRDMYDHRVYREIIKASWPELLRHRVNPNRKTDIIRLMKRLGIYTTYTNLKRRLLKQN